MNWKKAIIVVLDVVLACYIVAAMTAFNKPDTTSQVCTQVDIEIEEDQVPGLLAPSDVRHLLQQKGIYPLSLPLDDIKTRRIEEALKANDLIEKVVCYKTISGHVAIRLSQRMPVLRIMPNGEADYFIDQHGEAMPARLYTANLPVVTGCVSREYAKKQLRDVGVLLAEDNFWQHQVEQLNVCPDGRLEMAPRVGGHIVELRQPTDIQRKLERLKKFYRYGLSQVGWQQYRRISVEYDNQIVCKR